MKNTKNPLDIEIRADALVDIHWPAPQPLTIKDRARALSY
jgi:hypothetical protein